MFDAHGLGCHQYFLITMYCTKTWFFELWSVSTVLWHIAVTGNNKLKQFFVIRFSLDELHKFLHTNCVSEQQLRYIWYVQFYTPMYPLLTVLCVRYALSWGRDQHIPVLLLINLSSCTNYHIAEKLIDVYSIYRQIFLTGTKSRLVQMAGIVWWICNWLFRITQG